MTVENVFRITADLKHAVKAPKPTVTQADDVRFDIDITDGGKKWSPQEYTNLSRAALAVTRRDDTVVVTEGEIGKKSISFRLGKNAIEIPGEVEAAIQLYSGTDSRVTTIKFSFEVAEDPTGEGYVPSSDEMTFIETVMTDAQKKIDELSAVDVVQLTGEVTTARGGKASLDERLDGVDTQLAQSAKQYEINLSRWGIQNNGTDSASTTDGINNALKWAADNGYLHVILPAGTFLINSVNKTKTEATRRNEEAGIKIPSGMTFQMKKDTTLKVEPNNSASYSCIFLSKLQNNIKIIGGKIMGDRKTHDYTGDPTRSTHEWGFGIYLYGASDVLIDGVTIVDCTGDCITLHSPGMIGYDENNPYAPPSRIQIKNCVLDSARRNNISVTACDHVLIENCQILNAGINDGIKDGTLPKYGIDLEGYGEGNVDYETPLKVIVRGNKFVGNDNVSVGNYSGYEMVFTENFSDAALSYGYGTDTVISNNVFKRTDKTKKAISSLGVSQGEYGNHIAITGNTIHGFDTGMDIRGQNVSVVGNTIFDTNVAVNVFSCEEALISSNIIKKAATSAMNLSSSKKIKCIGNYIRDAYVGIQTPTSSSDISLLNNIFEFYYKGIDLLKSTKAVIKGNTLEQGDYATTSYSIIFDSNGIISIENNSIKNPKNYPIHCSGGSGTGKARILNNNVEEFTATPAFYLNAPNKYEVIGNQLSSARMASAGTGISFGAGTDGALVLNNKIYSVVTTALTNAINSSNATNSKIIANVCLSGAITSAPTDVLNGNITL